MTLRELIISIPEAKAAASVGNDNEVVRILNEPTELSIKEYRITYLTILDLFGPLRGSQILTNLNNIETFKWIMKCMEPSQIGVNIVHSDTESVLSSLVPSIITESEKNAILNLRNIYIGKSKKNLGFDVDVNLVSNALLLDRINGIVVEL